MTVLANTLTEAVRHLDGSGIDLMILNLHANGPEDKNFVAAACEKYPNITLVVLGEQKSCDAVIQFFRLGVFDYILKSDGVDAVLKRLLAVLEEVGRRKRRQNHLVQLEQLVAQLKTDMNVPGIGTPEILPMSKEDGRYLKQGPFVVDLHTRQVLYNEKRVVLTQGAFKYFLTLLRHAPNPVQHRTLVYEAQGYETLNSEAMSMAKWHIHQLRSTFKNAYSEDLIETIRGAGYRVKLPGDGSQ